MSKYEFASVLHEQGYDALVDGGVVYITINKALLYRTVSTVRKLAKQMNYNMSWGIRLAQDREDTKQ